MSRVKNWVRAGILGAVLFGAAVAAHAAGLGTLSGASAADDGVTVKFTHGLMKVSRDKQGCVCQRPVIRACLGRPKTRRDQISGGRGRPDF